MTRRSRCLFAAVAAFGLAFASFAVAAPVRATDSPSAGPFPRGALIRYVVLGDSLQENAPRLYADSLERDLGVRVRIDDRRVGGSTSSWWLEQLRTNMSLRAALRKADVITLNVPLRLVKKCNPVLYPSLATRAEQRRCHASIVAAYKRDTEAIFADIVNLHPPSEALIRAFDTWQYYYRGLHTLGLYTAVRPYWQKFNAIVHKVAARYQIPVARAYAAMNGATGNKDPIAAGYVSIDELHLTAKGISLLAKQFRNLGYQFAKPTP